MKAHKKPCRRGNHSSNSHHTGQGIESEFLPAEIQPGQFRNLSKLFDATLACAPQMLARTWADVFDSLAEGICSDCSRRRWEFIRKDKRLEKFWMWKVVETRPADLLRLLNRTALPTTLALRRIHNHALDMNWLPLPILSAKFWSLILAEQRPSSEINTLNLPAANSLIKANTSLPRLEIKLRS